MPDEELFSQQWVEVPLDAKEFPGYKGERIACSECGEGINYDRFIRRGEQILCQACADPESRYYRPISSKAEQE